MNEGTLAVKIDLKDKLGLHEAHKYLAPARYIVEEFLKGAGEVDVSQLQSLALPTSSDQPEEVPFVLVQGLRAQFTIGQRYVQFMYQLNENSYDDIAKLSANLMQLIFRKTEGGDEADSGVVEVGNVRTLEAQFNNFIEMKSFEESVAYLKDRELLNDKATIDEAGYLIRFSATSDYEWYDHLRSEYSTNVNSDTSVFATFSSFAMVLGGFDFEKLDFIAPNESKVQQFLASYTTEHVKKELESFYGKENAV